jgi:hypothetical protein
LVSFLAAQLFEMRVFAAPQSSVSQYGITFTFDKQYEVGTFLNGDYWVLGPVVITRITPDFDGTRHGWEVNPVYVHPPAQGFRGGIAGFNPALVPVLPYTAAPGKDFSFPTTPTGPTPTDMWMAISGLGTGTSSVAYPASGKGWPSHSV